MNDKLFEEMLLEIENMTPGEYWALYREAEKIHDFPFEDYTFTRIQLSEISLVTGRFHSNSTAETETINIFLDYSETFSDGDELWLKAA